MAIDNKISEQLVSSSLGTYGNGQTELITDQKTDIQSLSQSISFESTMITLMVLIQKNPDQVRIEENYLIVKNRNADLLGRLNYCMEILCNIPFTFEYNSIKDEYSFDFSHLSDEIGLIMKTEFN